MVGMNVLETARCPRCGVDAPMIPIVFGYPIPETFEAADRGEVILGGCVVWGEDPTHRCSACDRDVMIDRDLERGVSDGI